MVKHMPPEASISHGMPALTSAVEKRDNAAIFRKAKELCYESLSFVAVIGAYDDVDRHQLITFMPFPPKPPVACFFTIPTIFL